MAVGLERAEGWAEGRARDWARGLGGAAHGEEDRSSGEGGGTEERNRGELGMELVPPRVELAAAGPAHAAAEGGCPGGYPSQERCRVGEVDGVASGLPPSLCETCEGGLRSLNGVKERERRPRLACLAAVPACLKAWQQRVQAVPCLPLGQSCLPLGHLRAHSISHPPRTLSPGRLQPLHA